MTKNRKINGAQLVVQRKLKRMTQPQLAEVSHVAARTISRIEASLARSAHKTTIDRLAKTLRIDPEILFEAPAENDRSVSRDRRQLNVTIDVVNRNALALVARRYGMKQRDILAAAPLLFTILAEQSLAERRTAADYVEQRQGNKAHEFLLAETDSISDRDIFGRKLALDIDTREEANPFALFLTRCLCEIEGSGSAAVSWSGDEPSYQVAREQAQEVVGNAPAAVKHILSGRVALHEMPSHVRQGTREQRADWVIAQVDRMSAELAELNLDVISLDFDQIKFSDVAIGDFNEL